MDPEEEQRQRDEEARRAAAEAMAHIARIEVPRIDSPGMEISQEEVEAAERANEPPDTRAERGDFQPTTRQLNRQRDQALFNPEAAQRSARMIGDRWRAAEPPSDSHSRAQLAPGARPNSPFRVYPPGQMPQRTHAYFPPESAGPTSDQPAQRREVNPPPQPAAQADPVSSESAGEMAFAADDPLVLENEARDRQQRTVAAPQPPRQALASPVEQSADEFVDPEKPTGLPDRRAQLEALIARRSKAEGAQPGPQRPDYTGVDAADAVRRIFHNIANAGRAYAGRPSQAFRSLGDEARARDQRQALIDQRAAQQQSALRASGERTALDRERMSAQIADMRERRGLESRRLDVNEAAQAERSRLANAQMERQVRIADMQLRRLESEEAREAAMDDPNSEYSEQMRNTLRLGLRGYPPAAQERFESVHGAIDAMSGRAADRVIGMMRSGALFRDLTGRQPRGRGTGGGPGNAQTMEARVARAREAGLTDQQIASYGSDSRRLLAETERRERDAMSTEDESEGVEIVPGVRATIDIGDVEARALREDIASARAHSGALGEVDRIAQRYGPQAAIDPRIEAELVDPMQELLAMVAALRNSGVINGSELDSIEATIPNPQNLRQMTLGEVARRVRSFRSGLERQIRADLAVRGVDEAGQNRVTSFLTSGRFGDGSEAPSGAQAQQPQRQSNSVDVRINGEVVPISRGQLDAARERARQRGYSFEVME